MNPKRFATLILMFLIAGATMLASTRSVGATAPTELFFSEYVEGSSNNKALEIYNGTGAPVDLTGYTIEIYFNGSTSAGTTINLTGTVADGDVFVVADDGADAAILAVTDQTSTANFFNGDDAILLKNGTTVIDSIGQVGFDPGSQWGSGDASTQDNTLRRKAAVCAGDTDASDTFDPAVEWDGFANDTFDGLGSHTATCGGGVSGFSEPFDDASQFTTSTPFFSDGGGDYFGLTDGAADFDFGGDASPSALKPYTGFTGRFLTGMDLDGEGASLPIVVDWLGIDVSGLASLEFRGDFAEYFDTPGDIDASDYIRVTYQLDGGGYQNLLWFSGADFTSSSGSFNGNFREDTDFDGTGDGVTLGNAAQTFVKAIPGTGTTLDLRLSLLLDAGDEDFAVDNFIISEASPVVCAGAVPIASVQGTGDITPEAGNTVTVRGLVTADFGGEIVVQENSSTARSGIVVFSSGNSASQGDEVCVTGIASERFGQTQIGGNNNPNATIDILSSGNTLPAPVVLQTGDIATGAPNAEDWEAVLVRVETVTVANPDLGNGEFSVDDTSGPVRVDDKGFAFSPTAGQALDFVQGPLFYTFNNYKIEPRDAADIGVPAPPALTCEGSYTFTMVHAIQGSGATTPILGQEVIIEGIVVGDFQNNGSTDNGDLNGFYVQEEDSDADADPATSEGTFVFSASDDVAVGDKVRIQGTVAEYVTSGGASSMTQLTNPDVVVCASGETLPTATAITLPVSSLTDFEQYEGMLVTFPQALTISEYFNFDRFGEIVLATERQFQPTAQIAPGAAATALAAQQELARITLDDGRSSQNPDPAIHPDGNVFDLTNTFRGGDLVQGVTGVIDDTFGRYRVHPVQGATYTAVNDRPAAPESLGNPTMTVASFNVLNYFSTIDDGVNDICGPAQNLECRGADDANEFQRQRDKIFDALAIMDADVVGLIEIENHVTDAALVDLVTGLNDYIGGSPYDYIATGPIGTDAIKVAFIYKSASVTPVGPYAILDSSVDSRFNDTKNRPVLAQSFEDNGTGGIVTVAVNHLKSKGSPCIDVGDPDLGDGAGNCNLTRLAAAEAMVDWLATDPTGSGDPRTLIIGDLNSYDKEDPIAAILAGADDTLGTSDDYTDLSAQFNGEFAYGYVFDGRFGYLDYALANNSLLPYVTGVTEWHINADEPDILDYDTSFKQPAQQALYEPNAFRSSDHDPVIVGLDLTPPSVGAVCPVDPNVGNELTTILGDGMGSAQRSQIVSRIRVWDADDVIDLYGQMAAKALGGVRWVRFIYSNNSFEQVNSVTDLGVTGAISWWGADLDESTLAYRPFVKGRWFLEKGSKKVKVPRALVLYSTTSTPESYANVWSTFNAPGNYIDSAPGFSQTMTNTLSIPANVGAADIQVQLALADLDSAPSSVDVTVRANGVQVTQTVSKPINKQMESLNIVTITLPNVPAGATEVEIVVETAAGSGDSAALLGAAASYACGDTP